MTSRSRDGDRRLARHLHKRGKWPTLADCLREVQWWTVNAEFSKKEMDVKIDAGELDPPGKTGFLDEEWVGPCPECGYKIGTHPWCKVCSARGRAKREFRVVIDEGLLSEIDWELFAGQLEEHLETVYGFEDVEVEEKKS